MTNQIESYPAYEKEKVKVSVIIPVYNAERYLEQCLDSLLRQSLRDFEIIGIDCGSIDGSYRILKKYEQQDPRIHIFLEKNISAGSACNLGMERACAGSRYDMFLEAADFFEPDMLGLMYSQCEADRADICVCGGRVFDEISQKSRKADYFLNTAVLPGTRPFSAKDISSQIFQFTVCACWNRMLSRSFIEKKGLRFQDTSGVCANSFAMMTLAAADRITYISYVQVNHRQGFTRDLSPEMEQDPLDFYDALKYVQDDLRERGLCTSFNQSFVNCCLDVCLENLSTQKTGAGYSSVYHCLRTEGFEKLGLAGHSGSYFYNQDAYWKMQEILNTAPEIKIFDALKEAERNVNSLQRGFLPDEKLFDEIPLDGDARKVSVIIPVYNEEKYLVQCVESVMNQTLQNIEILCVNDGSTDSSPEILKSLQSQDERIHILNKENGGLSSARNCGLSAATGEYILFLDSDDYLEADAIRILYLYARFYNLDELFFLASVVFETKEDRSRNSSYLSYYQRSGVYPDTLAGTEFFALAMRRRDFRPSACLQLFRRGFLQASGLQFYEGIVHEDDLFTLQAVSLARRVRYLDLPLYKRRIHSDSIMTGRKGLRNAYGKFIVVKEMLSFLEEHKLYQFPEFYAEAIRYLSSECEQASRFLETMEPEEIWSYVLQLNENERAMYALLICGLDTARRSVTRAAENKAGRESAELRKQKLILSNELKTVKERRAQESAESAGRLRQLGAEKEKAEAKLKSEQEKRAELSDRLQKTYAEKSELNSRLQQTYAEKSELNSKLQQTYAEKSEINKKLQQAWQEKKERGLEIQSLRQQVSEQSREAKNLERELENLRNSRSYRLGRMLTAPVRHIKDGLKRAD